MTTATVNKPSNYSQSQIDEIVARSKSGPLTGDIAAALAATPLFAGKTKRSIISKISNLGLAYQKEGVKAVTGLKAKDETVMQIQDDIRAMFGIPAATSLNQKGGWIALRSAAEKLVAERDEANASLDALDADDEGAVSEDVQGD